MRKRILIIDDETDIVEILRARLEAEGYEVSCASDGHEALGKIPAEKPDLILLDVMMPKLNGYQLCRELKKREETKGIPVIMLTARTQESDKFWGRDCGADAYLTKPYKPEELLDKIRSLL